MKGFFMKRSKKGITLVELIISVAVSAMVIAAAYGLMYSAQKSYFSSTNILDNHLEASNLQTVLELNLPTVTEVDWDDELPSEDGVFSIGFDNNDIFTIRYGTSGYTLEDIESFSFTFTQLGTSNTARVHFSYVATLSNGTTTAGGVSLQNLGYEALPNTFTNPITIDGELNEDFYLIFSSNAVVTVPATEETLEETTD